MLGFGSNPEHRFEVLKYRDWPWLIERENMAKLKRTTLQEHTKYALVQYRSTRAGASNKSQKNVDTPVTKTYDFPGYLHLFCHMSLVQSTTPEYS